MRLAYFDCFAGISGDRLLGALVDAGLSPAALRDELAKLPVPEISLQAEKVVCGEIEATRLVIRSLGKPIERADQDAGHNGSSESARGYAPAYPGSYSNGRNSRHKLFPLCSAGYTAAELREIVNSSSLPDLVQQTTISALKRLSDGSKRPGNGDDHGASNGNGSRVSLYAPATLFEIAGAIAGLALLGIDRVECSPVNVGGGSLAASSTLRPTLSPVAANILREAGVPVYGSSVSRQLVDPTGAAIIATITSAFRPMPGMQIEAFGYGIGGTEDADELCALRIALGQPVTYDSSFGPPRHYSSPSPQGVSSPTAEEEELRVSFESHQQIGRQRGGAR